MRGRERPASPPSWTDPRWTGSPEGGPAARWLRALGLRRLDDGEEELRRIYRRFRASQVELIIAGACPFACKHCIYPTRFPQLNAELDVEQWRRVLDVCVHELGMTTFVHSGRSVNRAGVDILLYLRRIAPGARIGLIDNGISYVPFRSQLADIGLDWIDISIDGLEAEHDRQRGRPGAFRDAVDGALWLMSHAVTPRVSVLTCLTSINVATVIPMIRALNAQSFKNFFVTPVTVVDDLQPHPSLRVDASRFSSFLRDLLFEAARLDDAWVEVNMFGAEYFSALAAGHPDWARDFLPQHDALSRRTSFAGGRPDTTTDFSVNFLPASLTGLREFIVNTNGDVILPKAVSFGQVPPDCIIGNMARDPATALVGDLASSPAFQGYVDDFRRERRLLASYVR